MRGLVKKCGDSASVRCPAAMMACAKLSIDLAEGGRVIIEPIQGLAFSLVDLLAAVTDENIHAEVCFGPPAAGERL